jgi:hypothetical protein
MLLTFLLSAAAAFGQYKMEPVAGPPAELPPAFAALMQKQGVKITGAGGNAVCEIWFRSTAPSGPKSTEEGVSLPTIPIGALIGVIRFPANAQDRRGQKINPGVYTLRYVLHPVNGDHQGVAPQRDFVAMIPVGVDKDPAANPPLDKVVEMSTKASGTPHPAVLSLASGSGGQTFTKEGEHDWTLNTKIGDLPVAIILIGKAEG